MPCVLHSKARAYDLHNAILRPTCFFGSHTKPLAVAGRSHRRFCSWAVSEMINCQGYLLFDAELLLGPAELRARDNPGLPASGCSAEQIHTAM